MAQPASASSNRVRSGATGLPPGKGALLPPALSTPARASSAGYCNPDQDAQFLLHGPSLVVPAATAPGTFG
jgi:hypothetical protein